MNLSQILYNEAGRPRSGWRFLMFLSLFVFFGVLIGIAADAALSRLPIGYAPGGVLFLLVNASISLVLAVLFGWWCGKYLEDLPFRALGCAFTKNWVKNLVWGAIIGAVSVSFAVLIAVVFGGLKFQFNQTAGSSAILLTLSVSFVIFAVAAAFEEALFRGYMLQTFARSGLAWLAIGLTSLFFASAHLDNPNSNWISTANTAIAGVWFGVAYLKTRDLWFPFGLHLVWNWMQGAIFGVEVSGLKEITTAPVLREIDGGPAWLTGADYGIEASVSCFIALVFSIGLIYFLPFLKPSEEMLALTSVEKPKTPELSENIGDFD
jgi:uncharacterized protein